MGKYNFSRIANRLNTNSYKYDESNPNVLPMWVADMDFEVFPKIKETIISRANISCYGYTKVPDEYFLAYKNFYKRHHNVDFEISDCIYCSGVISAIDVIFRNLIEKGKGVIVQTPIYPTFFSCIKNNELIAVENKLKYCGNTYEIDYLDLENKLKLESTKVLLLCNPHNPTGYLFSVEELNMIAKLCKDNNVLLISDEIHGEIVDPGYTYHSILEIDEKYLDNVIALFAGSKCFNIAGLHSACIVIKNRKLKEIVEKAVYKDDVGEANYFACDANIVAFNEGDEWLKEMNEYIAKNKEYVYEYFKDEKVNVIKSHSTYLLWIDLASYISDSKEFADKLKADTGLWLSNGKDFLGNGQYFVRMNVATSLDNVKEGCKRLLNYLKSKR